MGNIIVPGQSMPQGQKLEISWDVGKIHPTLQEDLRYNQRVITAYIGSVVKAVQDSLNHPDTKPRVLTKSIVKERIDLCHDLLMMMRQELYWALKRCCAALPETLLEVLREGRKNADVVSSKDTRATLVKRNSQREAHIVDEIADPKEGDVLIPQEVEDVFDKEHG